MAMRTAELTKLRADAARHLPDVVEVLRSTETRSPTGGTTISPGAVVAVFASRLGPASGSTRMVASKVTAIETAVITMPWGADVKVTDRLRTGGITWEVEAVVDRSDEYDFLRKVVVSR